MRGPQGKPFGNGLLVRNEGNVGAWRVPHKDALSHCQFLLYLKDIFEVANRQDDIRGCSPISLLLCQGANYAKNGSENVSHCGPKKVNESGNNV